jgi:uncharacterized protein (TIGR02145 family)
MKIFWMLFITLVFISCLQSEPDSGSQSPAEIQSIQFNYLGKTAQITGDADSLYLKVQQQSQTLLESGYSFSDATFREDLIIKAQIPVQIQAQVFDELGELLWQADTSLLAQPDASIKLVLNLHPVIPISSSSQDVQVSSSSITQFFTDSRDGKVYKTVVIGNQIWMAEDLKYDTLGGIASWCYDNADSNCAYYGRLYTWSLAMGLDSAYNRTSIILPAPVQGICPSGWHIPREIEWNTLKDAVGGAWVAGLHLRTTFGWDDDGGDDSYGFSAQANGYYNKTSFLALGGNGLWWSATQSMNSPNNQVQILRLLSGSSVGSSLFDKAHGLAVRCINDDLVTISSSSSIQTSSSSRPPVFFHNGDSIMIHPTDNSDGVVWRYDFTTIGTTSSDDGMLNTSMIVSTYGNIPGSLYAARVCDSLVSFGYDDWYLPAENEALMFYANRSTIGNFESTIYWTSTQSKAMSLTTGSTSLYDIGTSLAVRCIRKTWNQPTISDQGGNIYGIITIGTQTWMAENLNFGTYIANGSGTNQADATTTSAQKYCYGDNAANCETYGGLYQWHTAMALPSSCNSTNAGTAPCIVNTPHRGLCPEGWHVPTQGEWATLDTRVDSDNGGMINDEGTSLKSTNLWSSGAGTDAYGWSGLPGGYRYNGAFDLRGSGGFWWSASQNNTNDAWSRNLYNGNASLIESSEYKSDNGFSLRCLKDET